MKKTMFIFLFNVLLIPFSAFAQVVFKAQLNKEEIGINQRVEVTFVINADADNFSPPLFNDFQIIGGPNYSYNNSWINGKHSFQKGISFVLIPKKKGTFTIGSATIEYEGRLYKTQPVKVKVGDAVKETPRRHPQSFWAQFFGEEESQMVQQPKIDESKIGKGIHLVAEISNNQPYLNEPITVTYKLYVSHQSGIRAMNPLSIPKFTNFWNHSESSDEMKVQIAQYKGKEYRMAIVKRSVLMPQKEGKLVIEPLEMEMLVEEMTGRYDFFGQPEVITSKKIFSTGSQVVQVKPLPLHNQPADFSGAVGDLNFEVSANKTTLKANETLELTVSVKGKGNLQLFSLPKPVAPSALEIYDPELVENITKDFSVGMQGSKTEKYVIVPQYKGKYTIEPMNFTYFDIKSKTYKTITSKEIVIDVTEGAELPTNAENEKDLKKSDTFFEILQVKPSTVSEYKNILDTNWFWILFLSPLFAIPSIILVSKYRENKAKDTEAILLRKNNRLASKYLSEARRKIGQKEAFYESLERCLHNFLKAKLKIETSEMSSENIEELLLGKGIEQSFISEFMRIKAVCEMARYSPFDIQTMQSDYQSAAELITQLQKQFKK